MTIASVVVPTHNRRESVLRLLGSLSAQTVNPASIEVIVVCDACRDGTADAVRRARVAPLVTVVESIGRGAASARNTGARLARGDVLIFLDDDMEALPGLVAAHCRAHAGRERIVALGYFDFVSRGWPTLPTIGARRWWSDRFLTKASTRHRPHFGDFVTGNVSLRRTDFWSVDGFDEIFRGYGNEDYELGIRLLEAGFTYEFHPEARSRHHVSSVRATWLDHAERQAEADVIFARKHPTVVPTLRLARILARQDRYARWARRAANHSVPGLATVARAVARLSNLTDQVGLRRLTGRLDDILELYLYWRQAVDAAGGPAALSALIGDRYRTLTATLPIRIDLAGPVPEVDVARYYARLWVIVSHRDEEIVSFSMPTYGEVVSAEALAAAIRRVVFDSAGRDAVWTGARSLADRSPAAPALAWLRRAPASEAA